MDLELSEDELELRDNVRRVLNAACPPSLVRSVFEGKDTGDALWERMAELYWPALGLPERFGGLGGTFVDVTIVVEELGRAVAPGPYLATVTQFVPAVCELGSATAGHAQRFLSAHDQINNLFHLRRDHVTAAEHRASRTQTFQVWAEICSMGCQ